MILIICRLNGTKHKYNTKKVKMHKNRTQNKNTKTIIAIIMLSIVNKEQEPNLNLEEH
jgi:hypothetical protein